jgi:hypothetical protein
MPAKRYSVEQIVAKLREERPPLHHLDQSPTASPRQRGHPAGSARGAVPQ